MSPNCAPVYTLFARLHKPAADLIPTLVDIISNRRTGSLTINFSQGIRAGPTEWQERVKPDIPADPQYCPYNTLQPEPDFLRSRPG